EVGDPALTRPYQRDGGRWCSRFKPDREEDHLPVAMLFGQLEGIERGVHEAHISTVGFGLKQIALAARYPHHIAERGKDHAWRLSNSDGIVHPPHGDHADRAARTMDELHIGRQDVLNAVTIDGVGVTTTHLHELEVITTGQFADAANERPRRDRVAVLV